MKLPENIRPKKALLNLTPMIDVVFLLIIFFIVSNNLISQDVSVPIELPGAVTAEETKEIDQRCITLNIPKSGLLLFGTVPVNDEQLQQLFAKMKDESSRQPPEVRIRTGADVPYKEVEKILVLAAQNGIMNVSFAVQAKDE